MNRTLYEMKNSLREVFQGNGNLLTIAGVALIIVSGVSIVDNRANWWITPVSIAAFFVMIFLFMNARVVIKIALTVILTILLAAAGFRVGVYSDERGTSGILWMGASLFLFFALLSYSYSTYSTKSRWGILFAAELTFFISMYVLLTLALNPILTTIASLVISSTVFILFYKVLTKLRLSRTKMPKNIMTDEDMYELGGIFQKDGWSVRALPRKEDGGGILVWKDKAYYLHPVVMESAFADSGRKKQKLSYQKRSINPWLLDVAYNLAPVGRARGAAIATVLLDVKGRNGDKPRVMAAAEPDTKRVVPIGILPAKTFSKTLPKSIESLMKDSTTSFPLSSRELAALSRIGAELDEDDDNAVE